VIKKRRNSQLRKKTGKSKEEKEGKKGEESGSRRNKRKGGCSNNGPRSLPTWRSCRRIWYDRRGREAQPNGGRATKKTNREKEAGRHSDTTRPTCRSSEGWGKGGIENTARQEKAGGKKVAQSLDLLLLKESI